MSEALEPDITTYETFNSFFTRALKEGARPLATDADALACPADGRVSALGKIDQGMILQAKQHNYSVASLLADSACADRFKGGSFITVYLSPRDYHRLHMAESGKLESMTHVPGRLFSVAPSSVETIPSLFARNERVVTLFETSHGAMAMVLVGAMNVASIETVWAGQVTPYGEHLRAQSGKQVTQWKYGLAGDEQAQNSPAHEQMHAENLRVVKSGEQFELARGDEMGRFNMGSTVIVLTENGIQFDPELVPGSPVNMGMALGHYRSS